VHPAVFRKGFVFRVENLLDLYCTLYRIHHTAKLGQKVITRRIHYSTPVLPDQLSHDSLVRSQSLYGGQFIFLHKATVAFNVRTEDCGQLALDIPCGHRITSLNKKATKGIDKSLRGFTFMTFW
jgi:hypothetical protein